MKLDTVANDFTASASPANEKSPQVREKPLYYRIWKARVSYIMLLPFLIPFIIFVIIPVINSIGLSMSEYNGGVTTPPEYVGFQNFSDLLSIEIVPQPRLVDEATGELMFTCGRQRIVASEVTAYEAAEGVTCRPAYARARDILSEGYSEFRQIDVFGSTYMIGARDPRFWTALFNTTIYVMFSVVLRVVIGLMLAIVLRRQNRLNMLLRILFFLPSVTAVIAVTVIWGWIFRGHPYGLVNAALLQFDVVDQAIPFLNSPNWTMPILILMAVWGGIGYTMILFLAGLQNISAELYEAAAIDGASPNQQFWSITLPLLRPTMVFVIVTSIIGSFQVFEPVYILFATAEGLGGALDSGLTVVPYLYDKGFRLFQFGYASAIAWVLFIIIFALTLINLRVGRANEAY